jgi:hypothetical protein
LSCGYARENVMRVDAKIRVTAVAFLWLISSVQSQAQNAWGAFAACSVPSGSVSTGFGSGPTQEVAKKGALNQASSDVNPGFPWKCNSVRVFNHGCAYIAEGCNDKRCGWAIAANAEEAVRKLDGQGYPKHEPSARGGGCVGQ